jgi:serine/threonine protein kinase
VLHNNKVLHQDIKPQNIMLNQKGEYVFIDFGISKLIKET